MICAHSDILIFLYCCIYYLLLFYFFYYFNRFLNTNMLTLRQLTNITILHVGFWPFYNNGSVHHCSSLCHNSIPSRRQSQVCSCCVSFQIVFLRTHFIRTHGNTDTFIYLKRVMSYVLFKCNAWEHLSFCFSFSHLTSFISIHIREDAQLGSFQFGLSWTIVLQTSLYFSLCTHDQEVLWGININ